MIEKPQLPLNQGQQAAAEGFFSFLFQDAKELNISGPGGVGKTFLMGHLIDQVLPQYFQTCQMMGIPPEYDEVVMTATTNKAAEVLGQNTGRPTETVHSFMNLKVVDNYETGESKISRTQNWRMHQRKILFVDEGSMVDSPLLKEIREGTCNCKVVYVGDHCQLAPVKERISPIYTQGLPFYELTQPMRNADQPALQAICTQLRHTVETGEFLPIQLVPGVIDLLDNQQMEAELRAVFLDPTVDSRILAYKNQRVCDYNAFIREVRGQPEMFQAGEFLVNNSAIRFKSGMLSVEDQVQVLNLKEQTSLIEIEDGVELEVRYADLQGPYGDIFTGIPIPVNRQHYTDLVKYYGRTKNWNRYYHLKNNYPDLRERDAATVYKAQGSTHDTVYIDLGNLSECHNPNQAARMLYVAFSRARTRVALFGKLAPKYGSLVQ